MNRGVRLATVAVRIVSLAQTFFEFHGVDFLLQPERAVLEYKLSAWYTARWGNVFFVGDILHRSTSPTEEFPPDLVD